MGICPFGKREPARVRNCVAFCTKMLPHSCNAAAAAGAAVLVRHSALCAARLRPSLTYSLIYCEQISLCVFVFVLATIKMLRADASHTRVRTLA